MLFLYECKYMRDVFSRCNSNSLTQHTLGTARALEERYYYKPFIFWFLCWYSCFMTVRTKKRSLTLDGGGGGGGRAPDEMNDKLLVQSQMTLKTTYIFNFWINLSDWVTRHIFSWTLPGTHSFHECVCECVCACVYECMIVWVNWNLF